MRIFKKTLIFFSCLFFTFSSFGDSFICNFQSTDSNKPFNQTIQITDVTLPLSTTDKYIFQMAPEEKPLLPSGYVLKSYVYVAQNKQASKILEACNRINKGQRYNLTGVSYSYFGVPHPIIFKGKGKSYYNLEKSEHNSRPFLEAINDQLKVSITQCSSPDKSQHVFKRLEELQKYLAENTSVKENNLFIKVRKGAEALEKIRNGQVPPSLSDEEKKEWARNIIWYFQYKSGMKSDDFVEGAFFYDNDDQDLLFNFLKTIGKNRVSSHLKKISNPKEHYEIPFSIGVTAGTLPGAKRTLLFFQVNNNGKKSLYLKPENYSLETAYDYAGHAVEFVASVARKTLPENTILGSDQGPTYKKERVSTDEKYYKEFIEYTQSKANTPEEIQKIKTEYSDRGISSIIDYINGLPESEKQNEKIKNTLALLKKRYPEEDLSYRVGDEKHISLTSKELASDLKKLVKHGNTNTAETEFAEDEWTVIETSQNHK